MLKKNIKRFLACISIIALLIGLFLGSPSFDTDAKSSGSASGPIGYKMSSKEIIQVFSDDAVQVSSVIPNKRSRSQSSSKSSSSSKSDDDDDDDDDDDEEETTDPYDYGEPDETMDKEKTILYYKTSFGSPNIELTQIKSNQTSVSIPDTVTCDNGRTYFVTAIETAVLSGNRTVKTLTIGNNVETIADHAFYQVHALESVTIGNRVTSIGAEAFLHLKRLSSVTFGTNLQFIGKRAFAGDDALSSLTFGNMMDTIGPGAFKNDIHITSVKFGDRIQTIARNAFRGNVSLTSVALPDSLYRLGNCAFYGDVHLTKATLGNRMTRIGAKAFAFTGITSLEIPDSVQTIGKHAFRGCDYMTDLTIGSGVTYISGESFRGNHYLTSITINARTLTGIGPKAFGGINHFAKFTINTSDRKDFRTKVRMIRASTVPKDVTFVWPDKDKNTKK